MRDQMVPTGWKNQIENSNEVCLIRIRNVKPSLPGAHCLAPAYSGVIQNISPDLLGNWGHKIITFLIEPHMI